MIDGRTQVLGINLHGTGRFSNVADPVYSGSIGKWIGPVGFRVYADYRDREIRPNVGMFFRHGRINFSVYGRPYQETGNALLRINVLEGGYFGINGTYDPVRGLEGEFEMSLPISIKLWRTKRIKGKDKSPGIVLSPVRIK